VDEEGHLTVRSEIENDTARVSLQGELDLHGADPVTAELDRLAASDVHAVLIDASGLSFLDSSGLRALLAGREKLKSAGVQLRIVEACDAVTRLLDMTGTRSLLEG